jgi:hypothetical protein
VVVGVVVRVAVEVVREVIVQISLVVLGVAHLLSLLLPQHLELLTQSQSALVEQNKQTVLIQYLARFLQPLVVEGVLGHLLLATLLVKMVEVAAVLLVQATLVL